MFAICLKYSKNYEDAEDTLQDSFLTIFNKINQFRHKGSFDGWVKRITINIDIEKYRKKIPLRIIKEEIIEDHEDDIMVNENSLNVDFLLNSIQQLPDRYRLVFNLYVLDDFSHKEIATLLEISEGTSKSNLSRARKILKQKVEKHYQKIKEA